MLIPGLRPEVQLFRPSSKTAFAFRYAPQRNFVCVSPIMSFNYFPKLCCSSANIVNQAQAIQSCTGQITLSGNGFTNRMRMKGPYRVFAKVTNLSSGTQVFCPFHSEASSVRTSVGQEPQFELPEPGPGQQSTNLLLTSYLCL